MLVRNMQVDPEEHQGKLAEENKELTRENARLKKIFIKKIFGSRARCEIQKSDAKIAQIDRKNRF